MSMSQTSETSRFSLWGMPLDVPALPPSDMSRDLARDLTHDMARPLASDLPRSLSGTQTQTQNSHAHTLHTIIECACLLKVSRCVRVCVFVCVCVCVSHGSRLCKSVAGVMIQKYSRCRSLFWLDTHTLAGHTHTHTDTHTHRHTHTHTHRISKGFDSSLRPFGSNWRHSVCAPVL
jgi:hypothetical protein